MTRSQRQRYEMFVRVRDFAAANPGLFPESSTAGASLARVASAVADVDEHMTRRVLATARAQRVKATTRAAVDDSLKAIAQAARRMTLEDPGQNPFRVPLNRSIKSRLAAARAFIMEAEKRKAELVRRGLPETFISDLQRLANDLEQASLVRVTSKTGRREAKAGIKAALADGLDAIHDLDVVVDNAVRPDPIRRAAWEAARRIEGLNRLRPTTETASSSSSDAQPVDGHAAAPSDAASASPPF